MISNRDDAERIAREILINGGHKPEEIKIQSITHANGSNFWEVKSKIGELEIELLLDGQTGKVLNRKEHRTIVRVINESVNISERLSASKTRQWYETNRKITTMLIVVWFSSSMIGYFVGDGVGLAIGLVLGGLSFVFPPHIVKRTHTDHYGSN